MFCNAEKTHQFWTHLPSTFSLLEAGTENSLLRRMLFAFLLSAQRCPAGRAPSPSVIEFEKVKVHGQRLHGGEVAEGSTCADVQGHIPFGEAACFYHCVGRQDGQHRDLHGPGDGLPQHLKPRLLQGDQFLLQQLLWRFPGPAWYLWCFLFIGRSRV